MKTTIKLQKGDILYSSWGYGQTNINFYKVKRLVGKTMVEVVRVESEEATEQPYHYEIRLCPLPFIERPNTFKRKIRGNDRPYISVSDYETATIWDGKPKSATHPNFGH